MEVWWQEQPRVCEFTNRRIKGQRQFITTCALFVLPNNSHRFTMLWWFYTHKSNCGNLERGDIANKQGLGGREESSRTGPKQAKPFPQLKQKLNRKWEYTWVIIAYRLNVVL